MTMLPRGRARGAPMVLRVLLIAWVAVVVTTGVAFAHANLARSDPPAGASLPASPPRAQLWFTEEVEPSFSKIVVYDANRQRVDRADSQVVPNDPRAMTVSLKPNLLTGSYVIAWEVQSKDDGHITRGIVPFGVGVTVPPTPTAETVDTGAVSGSPVEMALRWLSLLAMTALIGSVAFWILQDRALGNLPDGVRFTSVLPVQKAAATVAWGSFLVSHLVFLLNQAAVAGNVSLLGAIGAPVVQMAVATQYGRLWLVRTALGVVLGALLLGRWRLPPTRRALIDPAALLVGGGLLLSVSLSSHSAAMASFAPLGIANDWLHLVAVAVWVGGLFQLALLVSSLLAQGSATRRAAILGALVPRFATLAGLALGTLGVTGLGEALFHVGSIDNLLTSGYGQALLVKFVLIVPLVAIAAINHFVIRPVFLQARFKASPTALGRVDAAARLFCWTVPVEFLFAVGVIAVVGVMTSLSPARQFGSASAGPLSLSAPAAGLTTTFTVTPGQPGLNRYVVDIRDGGGQSSDLAVVGRWQVTALVREPGRDDVSATFGLAVTPDGARSLDAAPLQVSWPFYAGLVIAILGVLSIVRGVMLRDQDLRRAAVVALCGLSLGGIGSGLAYRDVQRAQAEATAGMQALVHPDTAQSVANGALVFRANCAVCHGADAQGDGPLAPSLNPRPSNLIVHISQHPDADLEDWIANGFPGSAMPAFKDKLSEQERWDVLNYLKAQVNAR